MERLLQNLESIGRISGIEFVMMHGEQITAVFGADESNPICTSPELRGYLVDNSEHQAAPFLYLDSHGVAFGCVSQEEQAFLFGPMPCKSMSPTENHVFCNFYGVDAAHEKFFPRYTADQILAATRLAEGIITGKECSDEELIKSNHLDHLSDTEIQHAQILLRLQEEEREIYHHTFTEELAILNCVKEGKPEEVRKRSMATDRKMGRLSNNEMNHWKYATVVAITLCSRAAMQSGVSPTTAYHFSDFFIQKLDDCDSVAAVISLRNKAVSLLAEQVQMKSRNRMDGYVDQCIDYITKHYRDKIYLDELASALGLSGNYLSKLFAKETGVKLQDYIVQYRVKRAQELLQSTNMSIIDIGIYVGFPSQSYFGRVFKKYTGSTPMKYRNDCMWRECSAE